MLCCLRDLWIFITRPIYGDCVLTEERVKKIVDDCSGAGLVQDATVLRHHLSSYRHVNNEIHVHLDIARHD